MATPPLLAALLTLATAAPAQDAEPKAPPPLVERLAGHPFLSKLPLQAAPGFPPVDLVLQEPYGAKPGWEAAPSNRFGPWAREVVRQFDERFAQPFSLVRDPRFPPASILVLASEGDMVNYRKSASGRRATAFMDASHDPRSDVVVAGAGSSARAVHLARFPALHLVAWRELVAHAESPAGGALPLWVYWGLPAYLAWHTGFGPDSLKTRELDRSVLTDWFEAHMEVRSKGRTLFTLAELVAAENRTAAAERMGENLAAAEMTLAPEHRMHLLWCASILWTHYLDSGEDGRWRDGYGAYVAGGLRGDWSLDALRTALQLDDVGLSELERGFHTWLVETGEALNLYAVVEEPEPEAAPVEPEPELPPLPPQPGEAALGHGLALVLARDGDLDGAVARLEALLAADPEGAYAQRIARDLERARGFRELRAALLAQLAESGDLLKLERDGRRINVRVASVEADGIRLRETRGGVDAIPFAELPSFPLAREMGRDVGWLRLWPYALVDDERWQRLLDADEPGAHELRDDAAEWYPGAIRLGEVAHELVAIGADEPPASKDAARELAERIGALVRDHGALAEVESRRASLRARAAEALESTWEPEQVGAGLAGTLESLEDGRARLTYAFDGEDELAELAPGPVYPAQRVEGYPTPVRESSQRISRGSLVASGSHGWRLPLPFRAPLSVHMRLEVGYVPDGGASGCYWSMGACDDGQGNVVLLEGMGTLTIIDLPVGISVWDRVPKQQLGDSVYELELRHDGTTATTFVDGEQVKQLEAATRTGGDVVLNMHSDAPLTFLGLVVEGELDLAGARTRWVERRLRELGLP